ncbi:helix-turn-helix transcriptional regulator [Ruegeria pomeroyi]|uniref:Helix-turn-helix transcriptional regulator n=1 Tax=Ruegeria pomeroyi TaxID=89184 RepID=A0A9Q3WPS0_9RHOB|nr:helix-turn-helix transcriptional regulator [Ruegeria pomeroyi]MCE8539996.1 helix-turn-helix transcriptional regulator [Ruegeria pomeroyi]
MSLTVRKIDTCLATIGSEAFAPVYVDLVDTLGIDQIMVFSIENDRARCLLSYHFSNAALAGKLAAAYLDGWFRRDPFLPALQAAEPNSVQLRCFEEIASEMGQEYRRMFFDAPGLLAKTTVLAVGETLRLFVSFYSSARSAGGCDPDLSRLAGRLALMHFELVEDTGIPAPLTVLSDREQAVCLGMLSGRKTETIAADLGVASSSVVTYRKRAYGKLGITSRAGLFAICSR